ncbi:transposase [Asticcacaulis sp.]|uniref:transposase n=1 Tax=Asticcacaulis sp. TaxID=1872648 RepID=UPI003457A4D9
MEPGAVVAQVARRHDLRPQQIYNWRSQFKPMAGARFVEVSVATALPDGGPVSPAQDKAPGSEIVEIGLRCGRTLRVRSCINLQNLSSLICCVEGA